MGDALLSAFLQALFQAIAEFLKEEQSERHLEERREHMISQLDMIQATLGQWRAH
jgi:hypothetical protein